MKTIFEEMGGTYRQVGDYFIPNITLPDDGEYQIGKYGRMRLSRQTASQSKFTEIAKPVGILLEQTHLPFLFYCFYV